MRLPGVSLGVWMGASAALLLADVASACDSEWGISYCASEGGNCVQGCCARGKRSLRDGGVNEAFPVWPVEETASPERRLQDACAMIIPQCPAGNVLCDDPHMNGLSGQSLEWSGDDGGWYSFIQDENVQINVRLTAPLPQDFPDRQLVTGLSFLSGDDHSFVVEVNNPYSVATTGCADGVHPCLAGGALRISVDGEEPAELRGPVEGARVYDGLTLSTSNLPVECWQFGGSTMWADKYDEIVNGSRSLSTEGFEEWVLRFAKKNMAAPEWCAKFVAENGLSGTQSTHAVLRIETSFLSVRVNVGINHQGGGEQDWDGRVLPDLDFWQMNMGLEGLVIGDSLSGILGETARPMHDDSGKPIMTGMEAIRGTVEDYRVTGALGTDFPLLHQNEGI